MNRARADTCRLKSTYVRWSKRGSGCLRASPQREKRKKRRGSSALLSPWRPFALVRLNYICGPVLMNFVLRFTRLMENGVRLLSNCAVRLDRLCTCPIWTHGKNINLTLRTERSRKKREWKAELKAESCFLGIATLFKLLTKWEKRNEEWRMCYDITHCFFFCIMIISLISFSDKFNLLFLYHNVWNGDVDKDFMHN